MSLKEANYVNEEGEEKPTQTVSSSSKMSDADVINLLQHLHMKVNDLAEENHRLRQELVRSDAAKNVSAAVSREVDLEIDLHHEDRVSDGYSEEYSKATIKQIGGASAIRMVSHVN
jgi:hypothetical protein